MKRFFIALALLLPLALSAYTSPGRPTGYVNDFAGVLSQEAKSSIETKLQSLKTATGNEVSVVTIKSLGDETIETYAEKLFQEWGIGDEKQDNGLLLLIAPEDREVRIEVGYGLEATITDLESSRIIREVIIPAFKDGSYDAGTTGAVDRIINDITSGSPPPEEPVARTASSIDPGSLIYPAVFIIVMLASFLGRSKSWWAGGIIGGVIGIVISLFLGFLFVGLISIVGLSLLGLLFDYLVSKSYQKHKDGGPPPWFLGGGGRGFGGGGGFGGFGGGMSGGGGASGKW